MVSSPKIMNILHSVGHVNTKIFFYPSDSRKRWMLRYVSGNPLSICHWAEQRAEDRTGQDDSAVISGTLSKIVITEADKSRHGVSREHNQESIFRC